jgi:hypothetical protein
MAFGHSMPKQISKSQSCVAASGDKMSSCGVFEVDLWIKGKKCTHPVNVIEELNENIIVIDFIQAHKLTYNVMAGEIHQSQNEFHCSPEESCAASHDLHGCKSPI